MPSTPETALTKPDVYEIKQIRLTSRALHIGSESQKLSPFEYVADKSNKFVYLPDTDALAKALQAKGYLNEYIDRIEQRQKITPLLKEALGDKWFQATSPDGRSIFPTQCRSLRQTDQEITDLRPMIRNGFGQLYIPGSSIKGAIRTAIAYYMLKYADRFRVPKQNQRSAIELQLQKSMGSLKQKAKFVDDALFSNALFSDFKLKDDHSQVKLGPNTDFMRAISITDSEPLIEKKIPLANGKNRFENLPITSEVLVSSRYANYSAKYRASIYAELVRNVQTTFTITINLYLLEQMLSLHGMEIPFKSVAEILQICQDFAQDQWDAEHDYWQDIQSNPNERNLSLDCSAIRDFYEPTICPYMLRLGWGSGMNGTTVGLLLDQQLRSQIRDTCGIKAPGFEAPKSRRTVLNAERENQFVLGWIKLS
jgi:CRISPR-associated protein Csm5